MNKDFPTVCQGRVKIIPNKMTVNKTVKVRHACEQFQDLMSLLSEL